MLPAEPVVVGVEADVVEVEELGPVHPRDVGVAANGLVLVGHPHHQDDVEGRGRVLEELGHDRLHACSERERSHSNCGARTVSRFANDVKSEYRC